MTAATEVVVKGCFHVLFGLQTTGKSDSYVTVVAAGLASIA